VVNLGDLIYSFRYRRTFPEEIVATETGKRQWIILPAGRSKYSFKLAQLARRLIAARTQSLRDNG